ncbi:hypothetical protein [Microvirga puerhi]|uniref:Uncharacterized protein n=1 Tax=Microvirga puerhi TaxID=2876078 RepID=A0ABS7VQN9_9HYPH|nr:hypothetical protein [Microvirga puerhi]MBZ6077868.1 hypothetical protein [Microvirga puerhi]
MDSDCNVRDRARREQAGKALFEIREQFLQETPRAPPGRLLVAALLMLAGLWIGLFSWLGSYAFEVSERWTSQDAAKPPSLAGGR